MCKLMSNNDPPVGTSNISLSTQIILMQLSKVLIIAENATAGIESDSGANFFVEDMHRSRIKSIDVADFSKKDREIVQRSSVLAEEFLGGWMVFVDKDPSGIGSISEVGYVVLTSGITVSLLLLDFLRGGL